MSSFVEIFYAFLLTFCTAIFLAGNYTTSSPQRLNIGARWLWRAAHSVVVMLKCKDLSCISCHWYQFWPLIVGKNLASREGRTSLSSLLQSEGDADHSDSEEVCFYRDTEMQWLLKGWWLKDQLWCPACFGCGCLWFEWEEFFRRYWKVFLVYSGTTYTPSKDIF
jgi:hypothetical protein